MKIRISHIWNAHNNGSLMMAANLIEYLAKSYPGAEFYADAKGKQNLDRIKASVLATDKIYGLENGQTGPELRRRTIRNVLGGVVQMHNPLKMRRRRDADECDKDYLENYQRMIERLLELPWLKDHKIVLLPHVALSGAEDAEVIERIRAMLPAELAKSLVIIADKELPIVLRLVLGHGLFTITGRMQRPCLPFRWAYPRSACLTASSLQGCSATPWTHTT